MKVDESGLVTHSAIRNSQFEIVMALFLNSFWDGPANAKRLGVRQPFGALEWNAENPRLPTVAVDVNRLMLWIGRNRDGAN